MSRVRRLHSWKKSPAVLPSASTLINDWILILILFWEILSLFFISRDIKMVVGRKMSKHSRCIMKYISTSGISIEMLQNHLAIFCSKTYR
jgi:hypothetical protein